MDINVPELSAFEGINTSSSSQNMRMRLIKTPSRESMASVSVKNKRYAVRRPNIVKKIDEWINAIVSDNSFHILPIACYIRENLGLSLLLHLSVQLQVDLNSPCLCFLSGRYCFYCVPIVA